ncbi:MAG: hypothetical protein EOP84_10610 [Verrucomicrobiaceae bacterium]|nr:MAG: hypothetical protein EOP84_10610 [Verrucomicrobiaceae bacterium]
MKPMPKYLLTILFFLAIQVAAYADPKDLIADEPLDLFLTTEANRFFTEVLKQRPLSDGSFRVKYLSQSPSALLFAAPGLPRIFLPWSSIVAFTSKRTQQ